MTKFKLWKQSKNLIVTKLKLWENMNYDKSQFMIKTKYKRVFGKKILTHWQLMRCSLGSVLRFSIFFNFFTFSGLSLFHEIPFWMCFLECWSNPDTREPCVLYTFIKKEAVGGFVLSIGNLHTQHWNKNIQLKEEFNILQSPPRPPP